jgi:hypothetical protein
MAGEAESEAKDFTRNNGSTKNAISLFDIAVGWEEFEGVLNWKDKFVGWLENDIISSGLLQKLFRYYDIFQTDTTNLSWKWNATYNLARMAKDTNNEVKKMALNELKSVLFTQIDFDKSFRFEALIVACRWAELELRDKKNN